MHVAMRPTWTQSMRRTPFLNRCATLRQPSYRVRFYHRGTHLDDDYVYGYSSVLGAIQARKREKMKRLFIQESSNKNKTNEESLREKIVAQCKQMGIPVEKKTKGQLNDLTHNKPHQGVVLQASPIIAKRIDGLGALQKGLGYYSAVTDAHQERGAQFALPPDRGPLWIALDEVQDPQNVGSILRTAHFFGVDGVIVCSKNSAPLSPAVSKVSAGAMEVMDIFETKKLVNFLKISAQHGWTIWGADASSSAESVFDRLPSDAKEPRLLVLGNEGTGLRTNVKIQCHRLVRIPPASTNALSHLKDRGAVDSLNVGVAAGILISRFLQSS